MEYIITPSTKKIQLPKRGYYTKGDSGDDIAIISSFLAFNFLGIESKIKVSIDDMLGGYFGNNLRAWIIEFQRLNNLEQDGNIGPITLNKLREYGLES